MILDHDRARALHAAASEVLPGGVSSNFRLNGTPVPLTFVRAEGPRLFDVDGNVYVDYALGMGADILGHAPRVGARGRAGVRSPGGQLFAGQHPSEAELARRLRDRMPSMERVRFGGSGSEMIHAAFRLARAFTGRSLVVKFEGHYHGWYDDILVNTAPPWGDARRRRQRARAPHEHRPGRAHGRGGPALERCGGAGAVPGRPRGRGGRGRQRAHRLQHVRHRAASRVRGGGPRGDRARPGRCSSTTRSSPGSVPRRAARRNAWASGPISPWSPRRSAAASPSRRSAAGRT